MGDYKKLLVWQKAHEVALIAHRIATGIRKSKYASLKNQIIRAAMSVPANIVEGRAQRSEREFARFLGYASGSAAELEYHLQVAHDFGVVNPAAYVVATEQLTEVRKMLRGLIRRLETANS